MAKNRKEFSFLLIKMPLAGLDFESSASANSATAALCPVFTEHIDNIIQVYKMQEKFNFFIHILYLFYI